MDGLQRHNSHTSEKDRKVKVDRYDKAVNESQKKEQGKTEQRRPELCEGVFVKL